MTATTPAGPPGGPRRRAAAVDRPSSSRRTGLLGLMVVALSVAVLTLAATTPGGIGAPAQTFQRAELEQRTFSCAGGIPGTSATHGTVQEGLEEPVPVTGSTVDVEEDRAVAIDAFAGQEARSKDWHAWLPCPEPRSRWWFVGAGAATVTHDTVFSVHNPRSGQAVVDLDVYGPDGPVEAPGLHGLTVAAGATRTIDLAKVAPAVGDLAVALVATRGLVSVSAADRFAPGVVGTEVREWLPAQSAPSTETTMTGLPADPDRASLVLVNPRQVEAVVSLEVVGATGTFAPEDEPTVTVGPGSVESVRIGSLFDGKPLAIRVTSEQRVTATVRTVTDGDVAFATGVRPIRGSTTVGVPSGTGAVVLSSVGPAGEVAVTAFGAEGKQLVDRRVTVPKGTSTSLRLPAATRYVRLVSDAPAAVAGFSFRDDAGVTTAGIAPALRSVMLPVVRPAW